MAVVNLPVALDDVLPLTCSRGGTCCHGNRIWLNPWELASIAASKGLTAREFRDRDCEIYGNALKLDGPPDHRNLPACGQYDPTVGCTIHTTRPLPCRLFPLGRLQSGEAAGYMQPGRTFPCLDGCAEVVNLPHLTVAEYVAAQEVAVHEQAHNAYLDIMQELAEGALVLLIDSGLAATGDKKTLPLWKELAGTTPESRAAFLGPEWLDRLTIPSLDARVDDQTAFIAAHRAQLAAAAQTAFSSLNDARSLARASATMMGLALHLGRALGAAPRTLLAHWLPTARQHGARE